MRRAGPRGAAGAALLLVAIVAACGDDHDRRGGVPTGTATVSPTPVPTATATPSAVIGDALSGGEGTVFDSTIAAFAQPSRNLPLSERTDFFVGNALFNRDWVTAPSSTEGSDGLGPVFNARSCSSCHFKDGRGRPPVPPEDDSVSILFRLSIPGAADDGGPLADPAYGTQLNQSAILQVPGEGRMLITYDEIPGTYADGETYSLRRPSYTLADLAFGPADPDLRVSPRTAPFMIGLGLLEALDEATILANADPDDRDGDGISGRPNYVHDAISGATRLGRFGWKANVPGLEQQNAGAFLGDIGITSPMFPDQNCMPAQRACAAAPSGGEPEIDQHKLDIVTFYSRHLAVPARRDLLDPDVQRGEQLFSSLGCAACHTTTLVTGQHADPALRGQRIHPYTDLLLHDMGEELADDRSDFLADGREWRTAPLWGIGLIQTVNRHNLLLHDGRARGPAEAILWHGGEAAAARDQFRNLPRADRDALLRFLASL